MNILIFRDDGIGDLIVTTSLIEKIILLNNKIKITLVVSDRNIGYAAILLDNGKVNKKDFKFRSCFRDYSIECKF